MHMKIHKLPRACAPLAALVLAVAGLGGCAPEVGSERWCEQLREKPAGDWTANEAADFARHCVFRDDDEDR